MSSPDRLAVMLFNDLYRYACGGQADGSGECAAYVAKVAHLEARQSQPTEAYTHTLQRCFKNLNKRAMPDNKAKECVASTTG